MKPSIHEKMVNIMSIFDSYKDPAGNPRGEDAYEEQQNTPFQIDSGDSDASWNADSNTNSGAPASSGGSMFVLEEKEPTSGEQFGAGLSDVANAAASSDPALRDAREFISVGEEELAKETLFNALRVMSELDEALLAQYDQTLHQVAAVDEIRRCYYELVKNHITFNPQVAVTLFQFTQKHYPESRAPADVIYPMARYLQSQDEARQALEMVNGFAKKFPGHPDIAKNYLIAAEIFALNFNRKEDALKIIQGLQNYPYLKTPEAQQILKKIQEA